MVDIFSDFVSKIKYITVIHNFYCSTFSFPFVLDVIFIKILIGVTDADGTNLLSILVSAEFNFLIIFVSCI